MAGVSITIEASDLDDAIARLRPLVDFRPGELMEAIGALGESQTRRRISEEKTSPEGDSWPPNQAGTPTLLETGRNLLDSVAYIATEDEAEWGAGWEHAHVHQFGAFAKEVTIPARPFVGLSGENRREIEDLVTDVFGIRR